jgi:transcriptional regulator with XRE-family HTH domain
LSPISAHLQELRKRYGVSQRELALRIGYEQAYISGIELGRKGPPPERFIQKLIIGLNLNAQEESSLRLAVLESQRKYVLPEDASTEEFRLFRELWNQLGKLHPAQIQIMREILRLPEQCNWGGPSVNLHYQPSENVKERQM